MRADRCTKGMDVRRTSRSEFIGGLNKFVKVAEANKLDNFMPCPCVDCRNIKEYTNSQTIQATCIGEVSCPTIIVGPSTEKEGLGWKTMKKKRMMR